MTPEIEKQIVSLIEAAKQTGNDAASFIAQQAPDVIAQLVRWKIAEGIFETVLGVALVWCGVKLFRLVYRKQQEGEIKEEIIWLPTGLAVAAMCIGGFVAAYNGATQTAKATIAPKVLILETIANLAGHK
jgi:hypothetical protein